MTVLGGISQINPALLIPIGEQLLIGTFACALLIYLKGDVEIEKPLLRLAIGLLCIRFFQDWAKWLVEFTQDLTDYVVSLGDRDSIRKLLVDAFEKAAKTPDASGNPTAFNIPAVIEQAWRTGVWGIIGAIVEFVFIVSFFLLESAREVLWTILLFLFPVAVGVFPLLPRVMTNLMVFAVELALWLPVLALIEIASGVVAKNYLVKSGSLGLYIVAVQIIAAVLILMIPSTVHKLVSGAFSGDLGLVEGGKGKSAVMAAWKFTRVFRGGV